jgi:TPR repeat protein
LGTIRRRYKRATPVISKSKSSKKRHPSNLSDSESEYSAADDDNTDIKTKENKSGWMNTIINRFNKFVDPEERAEEKADPQADSAKDVKSPTSGSKPTKDSKIKPPPKSVLTADDWYEEGVKHMTSKHWDKAAKSFERAAASSVPPHPESLRLLSELYGSTKLSNTIKAAEWSRRYQAVMATREGMLAHGKHLRSMSETDPKKDAEGVVLIRTAADLGLPEAMVEFGSYLREHGKGSEAMAWFHRSADAGHALAEEKVAEGYESGIGVPRDLVAGAAWRARVNARKKTELELSEKKRLEDEKKLEAARRDALIYSIEKEKQVEESRIREAEAKARRALDGPLRNAIRNVEWGYYINTGIDQLSKLALGGNVDARDYLDPDLSTVPAKCTLAMYHLGQYQAAQANATAAAKWFKRSAEGGYHEAMVTYAAYLIIGKGVDSMDAGQAMAWLMKAWDTGKNKEAALALGEAFSKGIGVPPDPQKAVHWYKKAFEVGGFSEAAFAVGLAYSTGFTPGSVDPSEWSQVQFQGNPNVNEVLKTRTEEKTNPSTPTSPTNTLNIPISNTASDLKSKTEAGAMPTSLLYQPLTPAITPVHSRSASPLPVVTLGGIKPALRNLTAIKQDIKHASEWYRKASDLGHIRAMNNLGEMYMMGRGVPRDDLIGLALFKKAADAGLPGECMRCLSIRNARFNGLFFLLLFFFAEALYNVGRCYRDGRGCAQNEELAVSYFARAHSRGKQIADFFLLSETKL